MAWTAPRTWVAGEIVTAALMNTHIRDNTRYLKGLDGVPTIESGLTIDNTDGDERLLLPLLSTAECTTVLNAEGEVAFDEQTHQMKEYDGTAVRILISEADVDDTPVNGATTVPVSSNWAYDFINTLTTQADLPYATAAGVWARLAKGTGLQYLRMNSGATAPEWGSGTLATVVRKTSAETVNNSEVLQNDDELVLAVGVNAIWWVYLRLRCTPASATPNYDIKFTVPVAGEFEWLDTGSHVTGVAAQPWLSANEVTFTSAAALTIIEIFGLYIGGANAGNLQLQWAQNVAHASNSQILANSFILAYPIA